MVVNAKDIQVYSTSDTPLAVYLLCKGFELQKIDYTNPRFVFKFLAPNNTILKYVETFLAGKALVDPASYSQMTRNVIRLQKNRLQWGD
jgi:hypothetical protein